MTQWLAEQSRPDRYKSDFQLRLFFANLLSHEQLLALLEDHHQWLTRSILILEERQHDLQTRMQGPTPEQELQFPLLVVELNLATFRAELAWIDGVIEQFAHQIA